MNPAAVRRILAGAVALGLTACAGGQVAPAPTDTPLPSPTRAPTKTTEPSFTPEPSSTAPPADAPLPTSPPPPIPVPEHEYALAACDLVTPELRDSLFGELQFEPISGFVSLYLDPPFAFTCDYHSTEGYIVFLRVWISHLTQVAEASYDLYREAAGPEAIDLGGIGDEAFWWPGALEIIARQANALVWVSFTRPQPDAPGKAHALAAAVMSGVAATASGELAPTPAATIDPASIDVGSVLILYPPDWSQREGRVCSLLTGDEAAAIIGDLTAGPAPQSAVGEDVGAVESCGYEGQVALLSLTVQVSDSPAGTHHWFADALGDAREGGSYTFVEGVGNRALLTGSADSEAWKLVVVDGTALLTLAVQGGRVEIETGALVELARKALERLTGLAG